MSCAASLRLERTGETPAAQPSVRAMRVETVDTILARVLFIVTGVALGAVTAASLVLTLRSWHILNVPPTVAAISSVGGACVFGAVWFLVEREGVRNAAMAFSPSRRWALILAMACSS